MAQIVFGLSPVPTLNLSMKISGVYANLQEKRHDLPMKLHEGDEGSIKAKQNSETTMNISGILLDLQELLVTSPWYLPIVFMKVVEVT